MKKFFSALLAMLMLCSIPMGVMAEAYGTGATRAVMPIAEVETNADNVSEENRLLEVLTQVKLIIEIPEEYTEFDYNFYNRYEKETWNFDWRTEDGMKSINIQADGNGKIISYNSYVRPNNPKAPTVFKAVALENAKAFIKKLYPEIMPQLSLNTDMVGNYFGSNTYSFYFVREVNGIPYGNNSVDVSVNYTDGSIRSFYINWQHDVKFDAPENIISAEDALAKWKSDSAMDLKYRIFTTYEDGKITETAAKLVYLNKDSQKNILALTGEYLEENYGWAAGDKFASMDSAEMEEAPMESINTSSGAANKVQFSDSELKRMEELDGYISVNEADSKVRSFTQLAIDDSFKLASYSTGYNYQPYTDTEDRPIVWNLNYTGPVKEGDFSPLTARATVDAVTGELVSFSTYRYYDFFDNEGNFKKPQLSMEKQAAEKLADSFLKAVQPEKYDNLALSSVNTTNNFHYDAANYGKSDSENNGAYYTAVAARYDRTHNDIQVMGNSASVTVDCVIGKITNYSVSWTEGLTFDSDKALVDEKTALDTYLESSDIELAYIHYTVYLYDEADENAEKAAASGKYFGGEAIETRDETRLIYNFSCPFYAVSAVNGKPVDYDGKEYAKREKVEFDGFNDIEGHWSENTVKLLSDIGVVLVDESFRPDDAITQKEFIAMLMAVSQNHAVVTRYDELDGYFNDLMTEMKYRSYYIPEKDADIEPDAPLMRKDAAKFIMRAMGYEKIATLGNIFRTDFADNDEIDSAYIGYAALANALGIINGSHGCFNGDENITRAESAILVYNYMNADK